MQDGYLGTSEFCGTCHDVRTPPDARLTNPVDPVTNEPFQRLGKPVYGMEKRPLRTDQ